MLRENQCATCGRPRFDTNDAELLDMIGYEVFKSHVNRYTMVARRKFHQLISGSEKLYRVKGMHVDHRYSIRESFENDIAPEVVSCPLNLRVIEGRMNISKGRRCEISLQELLEWHGTFLLHNPDWIRLITESDEKELDFPRNRGRGVMGVSCVLRSPTHVIEVREVV